MQITYYSVLYPVFGAAPSHVLFGLKQTKLCAGTWVGIGGKIKANETVVTATFRETEQEAPGLRIKPNSLRLRAVFDQDIGADLHRIFVLLGDAEEMYTPQATREFAEFQWFAKIETSGIFGKLDWLPKPLPQRDSSWLPLLFDDEEPIIARSRSDGSFSMERNAKLSWYDPIDQYVPYGARP